MLQVLPGDIVVLGSDGLFDNVSDGEVVTIAEQLLRENCCTPSELARCLLHNAYHNSLDRTKVTPYSMAATEVFDMVYSGGKKDDISVVVAKVRGVHTGPLLCMLLRLRLATIPCVPVGCEIGRANSHSPRGAGDRGPTALRAPMMKFMYACGWVLCTPRCPIQPRDVTSVKPLHVQLTWHNVHMLQRMLVELHGS